MATYTPNLNLYMPDTSDDFGDFRTEHNDNMVKIDNAIGGGGSGGHTIIDENGQSMTQRTGLEFTGNVSVTDDSVNDKTIVDILGGGGNVYGAFIDPSRIIVNSAYTSNLSYTATEDCYIYANVALNSNTGGSCAIDGDNVASWWNGSGGTVAETYGTYLKKGQTFTATASNPSSSAYIVYGLTQGTNGIFAPVIYSDNERVIGVWRDNKPLYQRTFVYTPSATISTTTSITTLSSDIEVKDIKGVAVNTQNNRVLPLCYAGSNFGTNFATSASNVLQIEIYGDTWGTNYTFLATVQYTKTTDVAGSGNWNTDGVPTHHYSTSEQVVGTWINNKPLYEITLTHSGALIVDNSFANDIGSLVNVDQFIGCEGYFRRTNANGLMYSLNGGTRPEGSADNKVSARYYNGNVQVAVNGYNDIEYIALTVRYTKTTDT